MEEYGAGPKLRGIMVKFWENQEVVTRQIRYHTSQLWATHGITQGGLASIMIFNVNINSLIRHWSSLMVEEVAVVHGGLGHMGGRSLVMLYADDGILGSQYPEWIQGDLNVLIGLFQRIGLADNGCALYWLH